MNKYLRIALIIVIIVAVILILTSMIKTKKVDNPFSYALEHGADLSKSGNYAIITVKGYRYQFAKDSTIKLFKESDTAVLFIKKGTYDGKWIKWEDGSKEKFVDVFR